MDKVINRNISGYAFSDVSVSQKTIGTTAVQLSTDTSCLSVLIKADDDNSDDIYIGKSGVTTSNGFRLKAGQAVTININNPSILYAISGSSDQKAYVLYEK